METAARGGTFKHHLKIPPPARPVVKMPAGAFREALGIKRRVEQTLSDGAADGRVFTHKRFSEMSQEPDGILRACVSRAEGKHELPAHRIGLVSALQGFEEAPQQLPRVLRITENNFGKAKLFGLRHDIFVGKHRRCIQRGFPHQVPDHTDKVCTFFVSVILDVCFHFFYWLDWFDFFVGLAFTHHGSRAEFV
jgi:hypothetical protein